MGSAIFDLCDEHVTRAAALDPVSATYRGITGHDGEGTDYGPDGAAARADLIRDTLRRLEPLDADPDPGVPDGPAEADRRAAAHLRERLTAELAWYDAAEWTCQLRASFGAPQSMRDSVDMIRRDGAEGWRAVCGRLAAVPGMLASWRAALDEGLTRGLVAARRQAVAAAEQADTYAAGTHDALLARYDAENPADGALRTDLAGAVSGAHAAYAETARYLRERYAPHAVERDGSGPRRHAVNARLVLGAEVDPREAYEWGWAELYRLEAEMAAEAHTIKPGSAVDEVEAELDATGYVEGADAYQDWLQTRHDEAIERLDGVHFDIAPALRRVEVVLAPASSTAGVYYAGPSEDLARPGRTWWSVAGRTRFTVWEELSTVYHEGVPGHHLQIGQLRAGGARLSRFSRLNNVSGHSEGWALYAERLADELGWYADRPGTRLGMLKAQAMRAARVVIDIGIHHDFPLPAAEVDRYGPQWTFEVGMAVLRERGRLAEHAVASEVARYCGWPAQAIAYKLGERAWLAARDEARGRLGAAFDLKAWHTAALDAGPVGLASLAGTLRRASEA